jgi:Flp pilus assembly protein TadD
MSEHEGVSAKSRVVIADAIAALREGDTADAERTLRRRIFEDPNDLEVTAALADFLAERQRDLEASLLYKRILAIAPGADQVRLALAYLLQRQSQFQAALNEVESLGPEFRSRFGPRSLEAALLGHLGQHERELSVYEQLLLEHPKNETLWMSYGNVLKTIGRTADAVLAHRKAIQARRTYGEAYWALANLKTFRFDRRDIAAMQRQLKGKLVPLDALHFHFALGKAFEDSGDAEQSFKHYAAGNTIRATGMHPQEMLVSGRVGAAIATFDHALFEDFSEVGDPAADPIFILGLHRSGSTLIEQILASHPMIEGTAELLVVEQLWARLGLSGSKSGNPFIEIAQLTPSELAALGSEYIERTSLFRLTDKPLFVDKQPANWMNIGFIKLILPKAKIIDARRHPMACGFSNFKQHYASGVTFSYNLEAIGRFYADYLRLMNHFDQVLPGSVHHVLNERLIDDPEGEVRRLLDYIGVPFDPACLEFHKSKRSVHTVSAEQVRRPINREGVDYWRRYEPWLGPLKDALGDSLETWDRVPA